LDEPRGNLGPVKPQKLAHAVTRQGRLVLVATQALNSMTRALELCARLSGELQSANTGGIHLTLNKTVNLTNYDTDADFAAMIGEATKNFSHAELDRLRSIAESASCAIDVQPAR
jgi:hypothetical protein